MSKNKFLKKTPIKAVLFDLGKVLVDFDFDPAFKRLAQHARCAPEAVKSYFMGSELEVLFDGGKLSNFQFYKRVKKDLRHRATYPEFTKIWNEVFTLKKEMLALLKKLSRHYRIVLISNTNGMHYVHIRDKYKFIHHFDKLILSYKEKIRKPDPRIYQLAMKACCAKAHEIFYIDDRLDLTDAAKELGFHAFTFKNNYSDLKKRMTELGIHHT